MNQEIKNNVIPINQDVLNSISKYDSIGTIKNILRDLPFYPTFWKTLTDHGLIWTNNFFRKIALNVSFSQKINWLFMMRKLIKNWVVENEQEFLGTCDQAIRALDFK